MLQAIIFDFDGVIADSEPLHLQAYQEILSGEGIDLTREDYYGKYLGFDDRGLFHALTRDKGVVVSDAQIDAWIGHKSSVIETRLSSPSVLFPGAIACVRALADRVPLAIASGALEPEIRLVLKGAGIAECFRTLASASDNVEGKPAPDLYLLALERLGKVAAVEASRCVAIEDSMWGLEAARAAGLRSVGITHTYPADHLRRADIVVDRLEQITVESLSRMWA